MSYLGWQRGKDSPGRGDSIQEGQEAGEIRAPSGRGRHVVWLEHGCEAGISWEEAGGVGLSRPRGCRDLQGELESPASNEALLKCLLIQRRALARYVEESG